MPVCRHPRRANPAPEGDPVRSRQYIGALFVLSVLVPSGLFLGIAADSHEEVWRDATRDTEGIVNVLVEQARKVFETQELVLDLVGDMIRESSEEEIASPRTSLRLAALSRRLDQTVSLWITHATGLVVAGSVAWEPGLNLSGNDSFMALREGDEAHFVSAPYVGRATGQPSFALSRRRPSSSGDFMGIIHVAISPRYFEEYFQMAAHGLAGSAALFREDGTILAQHPVGPLPVRLTPGSAAMRAIAAQPDSGTIQGHSLIDDMPRVYAYRRVSPYNVYVGYGADMPGRLAEWRGRVLIEALITLGAMLLLCGVTWLVWRSLEARTQTLAALRNEGDLRHAAERQLQEARSLESLGRMARGVAHDFNNMLTVVIGNLETLEQVAKDDASRKAIEHARNAAEAGAHLAASLLAYARTQVLAIETVDVAQLLRRMHGLMQDIATPGLRVVLDIPPGLPGCHADTAQLQACIGNLVANARDASPAGGEVRISARPARLSAAELNGNPSAQPGAFVAIAVSDHGAGMTREVAVRAFEPFFTTKPEGAGSGLGLSQVFGLMRQLHGHVTIRTAAGQGTAVTLYLPANEGQVLPEAAAMAPSPPGEAPAEAPPAEPVTVEKPAARILIVDDQPDVRAVAQTILARAGFRVVTASSGDEALRLLARDPAFDLVLSDVVMPDEIDGITLVRRLRETHPGMRALLMSGYAPGMEALGGLQIGFVRKPFNRKVLVDAVEAALA